jgi:hypothetical protein
MFALLRNQSMVVPCFAAFCPNGKVSFGLTKSTARTDPQDAFNPGRKGLPKI